MAMTPNQVKKAAEDAAAICNSGIALYLRCKQFVKHDSTMAYDWNANPNNAISGTEFIQSDVSNAITTMSKIVDLFEAVTVNGNANYQNFFQKMSEPLP